MILSEDKLTNIAIKWTKSIGSVTSLIIHTMFFIGSLGLYFFKVDTDTILLILTTVVSLEAIYLAIFIQLTINKQTEKLHSVAENVEEMQEDVEEMQEDVEEISENIDEDDEDDEDLIQIKETINKLMKEFISLKTQLKKK